MNCSFGSIRKTSPASEKARPSVNQIIPPLKPPFWITNASSATIVAGLAKYSNFFHATGHRDPIQDRQEECQPEEEIIHLRLPLSVPKAFEGFFVVAPVLAHFNF